MKIFQTVQANYKLLGISPAQSSHHFPHNPKIFLSFVNFGLTMASYIIYLFQVADNFKDYIECITTISALLIIVVCYGAVVFHTTELFENIDDMEKVIEMRSKYAASKTMFNKTNQKVEKWSEIIFFLAMKLSLPFFMLPVCIVSFGLYIFTDLGNEAFLFPVPIWFPFDTKNPIGYLIAFCIMYVIIGYGFYVTACTITLGIGSYFLVMSAIHDLKDILHSISKCTKTKSKRKQLQLQLHLYQNLSEFVELHSAMKRLVQRFGAIAQPMFLALFTWGLAAICAGLLALQIQMVHHEMNPIELVLLLSEAAHGFNGVFVGSELGQRVTNGFSQFRFQIGQFCWYLFPMEIKRMLPIIIIVANETVSLECFGSISLCRDVFKRIINTAFSYFMVLRRVIK